MIGTKTADVEAYWQRVRAAKGIAATEYHASTFSDPAYSMKLDEITELCRRGKKLGTAHMALDFERNGVPRRKPGDHWVILDRNNKPVAVVRMTKVEVKPFNEVGEAFARSEGEGDLSLAYWREAHGRFFRRQLTAWGKGWRDDLPVVCESFEIVHTA